MSHLCVDLHISDPVYANHLAAAGLPGWRSLSQLQREGVLCIDCGRDHDTMVPVGFAPGGRLFVCDDCYRALGHRALSVVR